MAGGNKDKDKKSHKKNIAKDISSKEKQSQNIPKLILSSAGVVENVELSRKKRKCKEATYVSPESDGESQPPMKLHLRPKKTARIVMPSDSDTESQSE